MIIQTQLGKSIVAFNPKTGEFHWVKCCRKPDRTGMRAEQRMPNGYLYIKAGGKHTSASRLAYRLVYKTNPGQLEIDHINRVKDDNRPENLRLVTRKQQLRNREFKPNKCNATGVSLHKSSGLYRARYCDKTTYHKTIEEAKAGYATLVEERI